MRHVEKVEGGRRRGKWRGERRQYEEGKREDSKESGKHWIGASRIGGGRE